MASVSVRHDDGKNLGKLKWLVAPTDPLTPLCRRIPFPTRIRTGTIESAQRSLLRMGMVVLFCARALTHPVMPCLRAGPVALERSPVVDLIHVLFAWRGATADAHRHVNC